MMNSNISSELKASNFALALPPTAQNMLDTPVSPPESNCLPLTPKGSKSTKRSRRLKSLPTSALVSISNEGDLLPYWNERCRELQSMLWCPTVTDCRELDSDSSKASSSAAMGPLSHLARRVKNTNSSARNCLSASSLPFAIPTMERGPQTREVSRKIRIYPKNRDEWFACLRAARRAYNFCIEAFRKWKQGDLVENQTTFRASIRKQVREEYPNVPSVLLDEAVNEAYLTRQAVIRKRKRGEKCDFSFRTRKSTKQSFVVQRLARGGPFPSFLQCHITEGLPAAAINKMAHVVWENGRWFLICKIEVAIVKSESQATAIVACDPGVRTFITAFSPADCVKIGQGFAKQIRPMLMRLDKLYSKRQKFLNRVPKMWKRCHKDRWRYFQKRIFSIRNKVQDLINDLHKRAADFLTKHYDVILLPTFEVSNMVTKASRRVSSKTVRAMLGLGHYRFKQFLAWIAYKRGKIVLSCSEAWTSRTDSRNGMVVERGPFNTINGLNRDVNGARGILLRALAT